MQGPGFKPQYCKKQKVNELSVFFGFKPQRLAGRKHIGRMEKDLRPQVWRGWQLCSSGSRNLSTESPWTQTWTAPTILSMHQVREAQLESWVPLHQQFYQDHTLWDGRQFNKSKSGCHHQKREKVSKTPIPASTTLYWVSTGSQQTAAHSPFL
jgi:hypothetical protein